MAGKLIKKNKKAFFDFEILETYEAGIKLRGPEVKSVKGGNISLKGSFVTIHDGKPTITNMHILPYKPAGTQNTSPDRPRTLLLKESEIERLDAKIATKGLSCVPLAVVLKHNLIKVEIGVVRGKKLHDKRRVIKERDEKRKVGRFIRETMKN